MNYATLNAQSWHTSVFSLWSPGSQLKFTSATAKNVLCCWYYWRIGCQHSCLKDRNRKRKTRKHCNFAGQYLSLHCSHAGSFSRRNCLIHRSLVNSKAEIIGRLIMLGARYIAKVIRHLGRLNHCVNEFGTLTLDSMQCLPSSQRINDNWSWAVPSLEGLECDLEIIVQAKL